MILAFITVMVVGSIYGWEKLREGPGTGRGRGPETAAPQNSTYLMRNKRGAEAPPLRVFLCEASQRHDSNNRDWLHRWECMARVDDLLGGPN